MKTDFMFIEGNVLARQAPTNDPHKSKLEVVITKEEFIACYNAWIKEEEK